MKLPQLTPRMFLFGLLGILVLGSIWTNTESLLFCQRFLSGEVRVLSGQGEMKKPVAFTDVCPEVRARAEANLNKWLEVLLALLVQTHPPSV